MDKVQVQLEVDNAHAMLDRLGAPGNRGYESIRERLDALLTEYVRDGRPLPTAEQIHYARFGPMDKE